MQEWVVCLPPRARAHTGTLKPTALRGQKEESTQRVNLEVLRSKQVRPLPSGELARGWTSPPAVASHHPSLELTPPSQGSEKPPSCGQISIFLTDTRCPRLYPAAESPEGPLQITLFNSFYFTLTCFAVCKVYSGDETQVNYIEWYVRRTGGFALPSNWAVMAWQQPPHILREGDRIRQEGTFQPSAWHFFIAVYLFFIMCFDRCLIKCYAPSVRSKSCDLPWF